MMLRLLPVFLLLLAAPVQADDAPTDTAALSARAKKAFEGKDYVKAIELWTKVLDKVDDPKYVLFIGAAHFKMENWLPAWEHVQRYLKVGRNEKKRKMAMTDLPTIERALAKTHRRVRLTATPAGKSFLLVKGRSKQPVAVFDSWLTPGTHSVTVTGPGRMDAVRDVKVDKVGPKLLQQSLAAGPVKKPAATGVPMWIGWTALGGGLAIVGVGALFNVLAVNQANDANDMSSDIADYRKKYDDEFDAARSKAFFGYMMYGLGGCVATAGGILLIRETVRAKRRGQQTSRPRLELTPLPGGGSVLIRF